MRKYSLSLTFFPLLFAVWSTLASNSSHVLGRVVHENGSPVANIEIIASGGTSVFTWTDTNGCFDLELSPDFWWIQADDVVLKENNLIQPQGLTFFITDDATTNTGADIVVRSLSGVISGRIYTTNNTRLSLVFLSCDTTINDSFYHVNAVTDSNGYYTASVCNGSWTVSTINVGSLGYEPPLPQETTVLNSTNSVDFFVVPVSPLLFNTVQVPNAFIGIPYFFQFDANGGAKPYGWGISGSLPDGLEFNYDGSIVGTSSKVTNTEFTVTLTDSLGISIERKFTIDSGYPLIFTKIQQTAPQKLELQLNCGTNGTYVLEYSTRLSSTNWNPLFTNTTATGVTLFTNVTPPDSQCFFRARQSLDQ